MESPISPRPHRSRHFGSTLGLLLASILAAAPIPAAFGASEGPVPAESWEAVEKPEDLGYSSEKLAEAQAFADTLSTVAVMIVLDGRVLAQWGRTDAKLPIHSIRKSILSTLYGRLVETGRIDLRSTMAELGIDDESPSLEEAEKQATVADLLTARSGVYHPANYETRGRAAQRPQRGSHPPGTFWYYNNWDFNTLGTIYEQAAGRSVFEAFEEELAEPLGMEDFALKDGRYLRSSASVHPAYTFNLSARDLARFGLLVLREGRWGERQIVPVDWLERSTRSHTDSEYGLGWGYMWWVADHGHAYPDFDAAGPVFHARGTGGHLVLVVPHRDLVIVHRVNSSMPNPANYVGARDLGKLLQMILDSKTDGANAPG